MDLKKENLQISSTNRMFAGVTHSKHTVKDSVFKDLFSDIENVRKLYLKLHPEDANIEADEIQNCTHNSVFVESLLNDLSFTVRDKRLIMIEAQAKWSLNVVFRLLEYAVQALSDYVKITNQDRYGSSLLNLPKVELYVLYTGEIRKRYEVLSLAKQYFDGDDSFLEAKVKVLYGDDGDDILCQYAMFIRILQQCCKKYGYIAEAVKQAIEICKNKDILKIYLEERGGEVVDIMTALFDQDYVTAVHVQSEVTKAVDKVTKEKDAVIDKQASTINEQASTINKQAQRMINTVKRMKAKDMSVTDIMDITGLTAEEIEGI